MWEYYTSPNEDYYSDYLWNYWTFKHKVLLNKSRILLIQVFFVLSWLRKMQFLQENLLRFLGYPSEIIQ